MTNQSDSDQLDEILLQLKTGISLSSSAPYPVFDDSVVGHAFDHAKQALTKYIEAACDKARIDECKSFATSDAAFFHRIEEPTDRQVETHEGLQSKYTRRIKELEAQLKRRQSE